MHRICRTYWWTAAAALFVFVLSTSPALAQGDALIRGQASAAADGSVLPAATVTLTSRETGTKRQAVTDANGAFVFAAVVPGEYLLSLAIDGFAPRDLRFTLAPREVRTLAVVLDVARLNVDVSVTAADERALRGTHSPSSTVLTEHDLEALPPFQRSSLPEAIVTSAPGMIRGHDDFVHVRGHEIALNPLINGVSFWENTHPVFSA